MNDVEDIRWRRIENAAALILAALCEGNSNDTIGESVLARIAVDRAVMLVKEVDRRKAAS